MSCCTPSGKERHKEKISKNDVEDDTGCSQCKAGCPKTNKQTSCRQTGSQYKGQALLQNALAVSNVAANKGTSSERSKTRLDKLKLKVVTLQANVKKSRDCTADFNLIISELESTIAKLQHDWNEVINALATAKEELEENISTHYRIFHWCTTPNKILPACTTKGNEERWMGLVVGYNRMSKPHDV